MGLPSRHIHFYWGEAHRKRALLEIISSSPLSPPFAIPVSFLVAFPRGEEDVGGVQRVVSGNLDHQGGRRSSFKGGETGSEKGRDLLGFHKGPVVEPAEPGSWPGAPPPPTHTLPSSRCQEAVEGPCPPHRAVVSSGTVGPPGVWVPCARTAVV